jgi:hypothetical protein
VHRRDPAAPEKGAAMTDRPATFRALTELELLKIIAVCAARLVVDLEQWPVDPDDDWIDVRVGDLSELAAALDRLDEFKRHEREAEHV